jgi:alanine dehydrogenase
MDPTEHSASQESPTTGRDLLLLSGRDLRRLMSPTASISALRDAYRDLADNRDDSGRSLGFVVEGGSIHVKAGLLPGSRSVFAAKLNVNLPGNEARHRLPTIQGVVVLVDATNGRPLALMDSIVLTALRTAATAALAAGYGARPEARSAAIIGCGTQAHYQLEALSACFPLEDIRVFDVARAKAEAFARGASSSALDCRVMTSVSAACERVDICVTCTTSKVPILTRDMDLAGCFVAAVGADNPEKQEIDPLLMQRARIVVDDLDACATGGDLSHALKTGDVSRDVVHADLADLAAGRKFGRGSADELVIFDSTGSGVQDVALASAAYRAALAAGVGGRFTMHSA